MFIRGGYNVFPAEVEAVLGELDQVAGIAIVAIPDDLLGELSVAVVVPSSVDSSPTLEDLRGFGSASLARHKLPDKMVLIDELPLTAAQKLDRARLRRSVTESLTSEHSSAHESMPMESSE
jgi:acyl-CoA synthetase (AMP-forming)/AMP-acid ligase II